MSVTWKSTLELRLSPYSELHVLFFCLNEMIRMRSGTSEDECELCRKVAVRTMFKLDIVAQELVSMQVGTLWGVQQQRTLVPRCI